MKRVVTLGVVASSAFIALALSGCVTEEVAFPELHTTAYVERDVPSVEEARAPTNAASAPIADSSNSSASGPSTVLPQPPDKGAIAK